MAIAHSHYLNGKRPELREFAEAVQAGLESDYRGYVRTKDGPQNEMQFIIVTSWGSRQVEKPDLIARVMADFPGISQPEPGRFVWKKPATIEKPNPPKVRGRKL